MKLSETFNNGKIMNKKAILQVDMKLDNGEERKVGDIVSVLLDKGHGEYHIEDNDFACTATDREIKFL